jgi:hypothetical protein
MKPTESKRRRNSALLLLLVCLALAGPIGLGTYLLQAASAPAPLSDPGGDLSADSSAQLSSPGGPDASPRISPLIKGVLYTNGSVKVNWSGVQIPVENSSYAYSGGELISTAPNAMGILKLDNGGVVFICPNSRIRLSQDSSGELLLEVAAGSGRFMFEDNDAFRVQVNDAVLTPASDERGEAPMLHAYTGEAVATSDGGCLLCNLSKSLEVGVDRGSTTSSVIAKGGQIVSVGGPGSVHSISSLDLPGNLLAGMRAAMASNAARGLGYLCKCRVLKDYAEVAGERFPGQPNLALTTEPAQREDDPNGAPAGESPGIPPPPDAQPEVAPPPVPEVTVADGFEPDPYMPGPSPGTGEEQPQGDSDVVVPPPLVPGSGSGGGGTVSSS